jgi:peptidyl-prolyl cis-trans isomerase SurA
LHKKNDYIKEFSKYEEQLSRNYIFEDKVTTDLAREAYERGLEEVMAAHILVLTTYDDTAQDTLVAYNKIKKIRDELVATGADFEAKAKEVSEEPNAAESGGNLGYFSVFALVYPFESAAYATPVGDISEITRTQFGYHLIKVLDKRERGSEITVSHIMITDKKGDARTFNPKERINEIAALLNQGQTFEDLVTLYSDDKNSVKKGGQLNRFGKGDLRSVEFEAAAFTLENEGDISKPFKSEFGWHIVRLDEKHGQASFEDKKAGLEKRVAEGSRSKMVVSAVNKLIKKKFGFKKGYDHGVFIDGIVANSVLNRRWKFDSVSPADDKLIFTIADAKYFFSDYAKFILERQMTTRAYKSKSRLLKDFYDEFETQELKRYFKDELERDNEEYASVISEYRDGLLIFDVMNKNVWNKVRKDSVGLKKYYDANKKNYQWQDRVGGDVFTTTDRVMAERVIQHLNEGKTAKVIKAELNTENKINVIVTSGIFEIDARDLPDGFTAAAGGVSEIYSEGEAFVVVNVRDEIPAGVKNFEEIKGRVMSDYQTEVETMWVKELRQKYDVKVNRKVLKRVKRALK